MTRCTNCLELTEVSHQVGDEFLCDKVEPLTKIERLEASVKVWKMSHINCVDAIHVAAGFDPKDQQGWLPLLEILKVARDKVGSS